ncbi:phosphopantetheine-binding protein, partial [Salmonella enterica subsp. enterica serovar Anatum]|nr:phosphopantetheine-binding protein [Salmonella enterica subsp. enterica serovar Anatum]
DVESDFFALGGHSLLAMKLAAQLSQTFNRQVTPGQVMVASDVLFLKRLRCIGDEKVMLIENRINIDLCPGIIDVDFTRENLFS